MDEVKRDTQRSLEETAARKPKRPYVSPQVEEIEVLTTLALGSPVEGGGGFRDRIF